MIRRRKVLNRLPQRPGQLDRPGQPGHRDGSTSSGSSGLGGPAALGPASRLPGRRAWGGRRRGQRQPGDKPGHRCRPDDAAASGHHALVRLRSVSAACDLADGRARQTGPIRRRWSKISHYRLENGGNWSKTSQRAAAAIAPAPRPRSASAGEPAAGGQRPDPRSGYAARIRPAGRNRLIRFAPCRMTGSAGLGCGEAEPGCPGDRAGSQGLRRPR